MLAERGVKPEDADKSSAVAAASAASPTAGPVNRGPRDNRDHDRQGQSHRLDNDRSQRGGQAGSRGGRSDRGNDRGDRSGFGTGVGAGANKQAPRGAAKDGDDGEWTQAGGGNRRGGRKAVPVAKAATSAGAANAADEDQGVVDPNAFNALGLDDQPDDSQDKDDGADVDDDAGGSTAPIKSTGSCSAVGLSAVVESTVASWLMFEHDGLTAAGKKGKAKKGPASADDDDF